MLPSHDRVYGPGGQSLYNDKDNGWVIVYHCKYSVPNYVF